MNLAKDVVSSDIIDINKSIQENMFKTMQILAILEVFTTAYIYGATWEQKWSRALQIILLMQTCSSFIPNNTVHILFIFPLYSDYLSNNKAHETTAVSSWI